MKKVKVRIQYNWWGNAHIKNRMWCAIFETNGNNGEIKGDAWDYGSKDYLVKECKEYGYLYKVLRHHKGGKYHKRGDVSIVESNYLKLKKRFYY